MPYCCKLYGEQIKFTGDIAVAWEVYQKLLSFSSVSDFGSITINFDLLNNIPIELDDPVFFWEVLEIIHLKTVNHIAQKMRSKHR